MRHAFRSAILSLIALPAMAQTASFRPNTVTLATENPSNENLAAGGWLNAWMKVGHYEVTGDLATSFNFSSTAVDILRDAAQDPDFYEFDNPEAHSQSPDAVAAISPSLEPAKRNEATNKAINTYVAWVKNNVRRVDAAIQAGRTREALYFLGYVLHGVEDLAAHRGLTNYEHALLNSQSKSPDDNTDNIAQARVYAKEFMRSMLIHVGDNATNQLRSYQGSGILSKTEKTKLLGKGWDPFTWARGCVAFERSGSNWTSSNVSVRWDANSVFTMLTNSL